MNWTRDKWRKVYRRPVGVRGCLSLFSACLRNQLLKICDNDGVVTLSSGQTVFESVCRSIGGVDANDRLLVQNCLNELFAARAIAQTAAFELQICRFDTEQRKWRRGDPGYEDWSNEAYRKVYTAESGNFSRLPALTRGFAAEVLRFCDDYGRIWPPNPGQTWGHVFAPVTNKRHRRRTVSMVRELEADGFLHIDDQGRINVRNFTKAHRVVEEHAANGGERMANDDRTHHQVKVAESFNDADKHERTGRLVKDDPKTVESTHPGTLVGRLSDGYGTHHQVKIAESLKTAPLDRQTERRREKEEEEPPLPPSGLDFGAGTGLSTGAVEAMVALSTTTGPPIPAPTPSAVPSSEPVPAKSEPRPMLDAGGEPIVFESEPPWPLTVEVFEDLARAFRNFTRAELLEHVMGAWFAAKNPSSGKKKTAAAVPDSLRRWLKNETEDQKKRAREAQQPPSPRDLEVARVSSIAEKRQAREAAEAKRREDANVAFEANVSADQKLWAKGWLERPGNLTGTALPKCGLFRADWEAVIDDHLAANPDINPPWLAAWKRGEQGDRTPSDKPHVTPPESKPMVQAAAPMAVSPPQLAPPAQEPIGQGVSPTLGNRAPPQRAYAEPQTVLEPVAAVAGAKVSAAIDPPKRPVNAPRVGIKSDAW